MKTWMLSVKAAVLGTALLVAQGCGSSQTTLEFNGVKGPIFNIVNGSVIITMKFTNLVVDAGAQIPIPHTNASYAALGPNVVDGGMMLEVTLATSDLESLDIGVGDGTTLPDGRALPGVPGGVLTNSLRLDTHIGSQEISFYLSKAVVGFSMPFGFDTAGVSGYWNVSVNSKQVGFLGIVGSDSSGHKATGVVLLNLASLQSSQLKSLIKLSKRNPHMVY